MGAIPCPAAAGGASAARWRWPHDFPGRPVRPALAGRRARLHRGGAGFSESGDRSGDVGIQRDERLRAGDVPVVHKPGELVLLAAPVSYPDYKRYRDRVDLFSGITAYAAPIPFSIGSGADAQRI